VGWWLDLGMPYTLNCRNCKTPIKISEIRDGYANYECLSCGSPNEFDNMESLKKNLVEIGGSKPIENISQPNVKIIKKQYSLSKKYVVLEIYKILAYLLMIFNTALTIYSFVQTIEISNAMGVSAANLTLVTLVITYFISMFSLFCLTKMINFLFDLERHKSDK